MCACVVVRRCAEARYRVFGCTHKGCKRPSTPRPNSLPTLFFCFFYLLVAHTVCGSVSSVEPRWPTACDRAVGCAAGDSVARRVRSCISVHSHRHRSAKRWTEQMLATLAIEIWYTPQHFCYNPDTYGTLKNTRVHTHAPSKGVPKAQGREMHQLGKDRAVGTAHQ